MHRFLVFNNIGRSKFCGKKLLHAEIVTPDDIAHVACLEASQHLMSNSVDCTYNANTNIGQVFAGFHTVGTFAVQTEERLKS